MKPSAVAKMIATLEGWRDHEEEMESCEREARADVASERLDALNSAIEALEALADVE